MSESRPRPVGARPSTMRLAMGQIRYVNRGFWRTPVAAFFTVVLPLMFLVLVGLATGNQLIDGRIRVAQFFTPALCAFGVAMATFTLPAISLAQAREQGVLKRLRGTPLPAAVYLVGRLVSAVLVALLSVVLLVTVAVVGFGVEIYAATLPAAAVTLLVGIVTFAALAFALVALVGRTATVQTVANAAVIILGFVSDIFIVGDGLPVWFQRLGDLFPLKHFVNALALAFDPFREVSPWAWDHLGVMAAWALVGVVIATWRFSWHPPVARQPRRGRHAVGGGAAGLTVRELGRPPALRLLVAQARYATRATWRDVGSVFFAIAMPVLLVMLLPAVFGDAPVVDGVPIAAWIAPAMAVYGTAVHAFVNLSEQVATARDNGVEKRLRGTPLPAWIQLGGRLASALGIGALITVVSLAVAAGMHGERYAVRQLPLLVVVFVVGTTSTAILGLALAGVVRSARAVPAVALGILLPLSFLSDIFLFGTAMPAALDAVGWALPLRHFVHAMVGASAGPDVFTTSTWTHLAVMAAWGVGGALVMALTSRRSATWPSRPTPTGPDETVPTPVRTREPSPAG
ncbi:MAG TPA: ABC transporter permease [Egicoccus sp.]|nr:ABC transporter permease [Egicoccus sp.]HSK25091.1 ABC transporter permease [Egicoccus sp.]